MAAPLVPDELWSVVEPLLPAPKPRTKGGRRPLDNRAALTGIIFVLKSGIPWEMLPLEMGCGCGMTCWRRLRDWQAAGVWQRLHEVLLARLREAEKIDWSRASLDSASVPALGVSSKRLPPGGAMLRREAKRGAPRPARARRIAASRARSGMSWSTARARRSASC
jgi:transposase